MDYFTILRVDSGATSSEIKRAYRKLVFKFHPDRNKDRSAKKIYAQISKAYKVLIDPIQRQAYINGSQFNVTEDPIDFTKAYWKKIMTIEQIRGK